MGSGYTPPVLEFDIDSFQFKFIKDSSANLITGFTLETGNLSYGSWDGHEYTVYSYFDFGEDHGEFDGQSSISDLINRGVSLGTKTLNGIPSADWKKQI